MRPFHSFMKDSLITLPEFMGWSVSSLMSISWTFLAACGYTAATNDGVVSRIMSKFGLEWQMHIFPPPCISFYWNWEFSWCQLCCHWWHQKLMVSPMMRKLAAWYYWFSVFCIWAKPFYYSYRSKPFYHYRNYLSHIYLFIMCYGPLYHHAVSPK